MVVRECLKPLLRRRLLPQQREAGKVLLLSRFRFDDTPSLLIVRHINPSGILSSVFPAEHRHGWFATLYLATVLFVEAL